MTIEQMMDLMVKEANCLSDIVQSLATIEELLKDIRSNQKKWPLPSLDDGWDRNTTPPPCPPVRFPNERQRYPRWPTDPWGNPVPYTMYCGKCMEGTTGSTTAVSHDN